MKKYTVVTILVLVFITMNIMPVSAQGGLTNGHIFEVFNLTERNVEYATTHEPWYSGPEWTIYGCLVYDVDLEAPFDYRFDCADQVNEEFGLSLNGGSVSTHQWEVGQDDQVNIEGYPNAILLTVAVKGN